HDQRLRVRQQGGALRQHQVGRMDLGPDLGAGDRHLDAVGDVGRLGLDLDRRVLGDDQRLGGCVAGDVDRDVDGDLLTATYGDEVDVLEDPADRVDLHLLGQGQLGVAVDVELEQGVRAAVLERHHRVVT